MAHYEKTKVYRPKFKSIKLGTKQIRRPFLYLACDRVQLLYFFKKLKPLYGYETNIGEWIHEKELFGMAASEKVSIEEILLKIVILKNEITFVWLVR